MKSRIYHRIRRRHLRNLRKFLRATFSFWEGLGFHVTPNRYDQPIPDSRALPDDLWTRQSEMIGIDMREEAQLRMLSVFSSRYKTEYERFLREKTPIEHRYYLGNGGYDYVDGEILYCMIREFQPSRIIEIGSGSSTYCSAEACRTNEERDGRRCELIAIDPYPSGVLRRGFPGLTGLIAKPIQQVPLSYFDQLKPNDILFIDSSHVLAIGSDVQYEYLEVLPRLNEGVIVHVHDIFLPADYPRNWVMRKRHFWTEQYVLQAFLTFNDRFEVLWASGYMHRRHPDKLRAAFRSYRTHGGNPGSFWMRRVRRET